MREAGGQTGQGRGAWLALATAALLLLPACLPRVESLGEGRPPGYITGNIPAEYAGRRNPFDWQDAAARQAGQQAYFSGTLSCGVCHGGAGRGDGAKAPYLDYTPADFAAPPMVNAFRQHQDYVFWWVSEGVPQSSMPGFKELLSETERWQAITYAWSLGEQPVAAGGQTGARRGRPDPAPPAAQGAPAATGQR